MNTGKKRKSDKTDKIKVVVKNRPTKEQSVSKIKQLGEFLSSNWQFKENNPLG